MMILGSAAFLAFPASGDNKMCYINRFACKNM